jgi:uncharacterized protein
MRPITLLIIALSIMVLAPRQAVSQEADRRTVSVSGEGIFRVEPDMAIVRFGVVTHSDDPEEARRTNAAAAREAMNAVRELGIDERRIRMESLRLQPRREYVQETRRWVERGFEAVRDVVVHVDDIERLPDVVTRVVQRGANRLNQVSYELSNRDEARNAALRIAVENARSKAELMASVLGERLGPVRTITEQQFDFPRPMYRAAMDMAAVSAEAAPEPEAFASGEIEVRATVQLVFDLQ